MSLTNNDARQGQFLSRPFSLAAAILVQLGLLYAFTHGMNIKDLVKPLDVSKVVFIPLEEPPKPETPPEIKKLPNVDTLVPDVPSVPVPEDTVVPVDIPADVPVENSQGITTEAVSSPPLVTSFGVTHRVDPVYPSAARRAGVEGTVVLNVVIGLDGKVAGITIASSSGSSVLDEVAIEAVKRWRFTKPESGSVQVKLPISFKLENAR